MVKQEKTGRRPFPSIIFHSLGNQTRNFFGEDSSFGPLVPLIKMAGNLMYYKPKRHSQSHVMGFKYIVSNVKKGSDSLSATNQTTTYGSQHQNHNKSTILLSPASDLAVRKAWLVPLFGCASKHEQQKRFPCSTNSNCWYDVTWHVMIGPEALNVFLLEWL